MIHPDRREWDNEDGKKVIANLGTSYVVELGHGDYLITGNNIRAGIERMTASGLITDVLSGRAVDKLEGMSHYFDVLFLIIEGILLPSKDGYCLVQRKGHKFSYYGPGGMEGAGFSTNFTCRRTQYNYIDDFLTSVSLRWVHRVIYTMTPIESARRLVELDKYLNKPEHTLHLTRSKPFSGFERATNPAVDALSCFKNVGREKAQVLLKAKGTFAGVIASTEAELRQIIGIGPVVAKSVYNEARKEYK